MPVMSEFDPAVDGWYFENWGEQSPYCIDSCEFSWDLYRQTYLGINPSHDPVAAPLDCAFYEIFKSCAEKGNCGGMSLLALALFKYGGYMGFCSPASFYTGTKSPDREELHRAINIFQARQFSASGIENFLDVVDGSNLNNAVAAFNRVKQLMGTANYPLLSIASSALGDAAHTVIPYRWEENPSGYPFGTKILYIWDPNHPYDAPNNPARYAGNACHMVINSETDWTYTNHKNNYRGDDPAGAWCFVVPMSAVLHKSRQPMALDMVFDALMTIFVTGSGAAVSQVSDDVGHRFYTAPGDMHESRADIESDPAHRLEGVGRWPWYGRVGERGLPGELYFVRRSVGKKDLTWTLAGPKYRLVMAFAGDLLEIETQSRSHAREEIRVSGLSSDSRTIDIRPQGEPRQLQVRHLRQKKGTAGWRSVRLKNLSVPSKGLKIQVLGDQEMVQVEGHVNPVETEVEMEQHRDGKTVTAGTGQLRVPRNRVLRVSPRDWSRPQKSRLRRQIFERG